jgi:Tfp pilus assembly protein PilO
MMNAKNAFGAFVMAIALFFFWPVVVGSWQTVQALSAAQADRQALLEQRKTILSHVNDEQATYAKKLTGQTATMFDALVPAQKSSAELLSAIQDMATSAGLQLVELRTSEAAVAQSAAGSQSSSSKTLSLQVDLGGTYSGLRSFLGSLEQYVRVLNVNSIDVNKDTQNPGKLKFTVKADAYFIK